MLGATGSCSSLPSRSGAWLSQPVRDFGQPQFPPLVLWEGCTTLLAAGTSRQALGGHRQRHDPRPQVPDDKLQEGRILIPCGIAVG